MTFDGITRAPGAAGDREQFARQLRIERGALSVEKLAEVTGVSVRSIDGLECGDRDPTTLMCWRIGDGIARHAGRDERTAAAIVARLLDAGGPNVRDRSRRPQRRRARLLAEARAEAAGRVPAAAGDTAAHIAATVLGAGVRS